MDGHGGGDGHWYRVNHANREGMDMFMAQIERNVGNISGQIVFHIYCYSIINKIKKKILFSDVLLFWNSQKVA